MVSRGLLTIFKVKTITVCSWWNKIFYILSDLGELRGEK